MGIHGLLKEIGHGQRISLAKLSAEYYAANDRPFRLAIDISIWLFQIQSGKGGSNPALRTFYYRLLRLLSLNIHPLFVFDGPNKPLFKRNKKVGGPGVRVASVPEFLAKQLLKQFGFPWHVSPGEAEAECALLQREGIVDAVLSEDVDTLMFGSGVTLRNWTAENSTKTPTHVDVHRAEATKAGSGMDREGMILVALMSGGDYLPEGIPGCGPKVACDAARAGFGKDLCALRRSDVAGLEAWKERLLREVQTNESKFFTRKNMKFSIPEDFPNREVLGFYTHPCVSTSEKLLRLRHELQWDQPIDYIALRSFTADAFDWRCLGGAKKFIKNLAPALLVRELRLSGDGNEQLDLEAQEEKEKRYVQAIHGKRNHTTVDGELEYRISLIPADLVPIDLSIEDDDDDFVPAGGPTDDASDVESEFMVLPSSTQGDNESDVPASPRKRNFRPYDPSQSEKLWMLHPFLQVGCPLLVEEYEASTKDPKEFLKQRRKAKAAAQGDSNIQAIKPTSKKSKPKETDMPANAMMAYAKVNKTTGRPPLKESKSEANSRWNSQRPEKDGLDDADFATVANFKLPSTQVPTGLMQAKAAQLSVSKTIEVLNLANPERPTGYTTQPTRPNQPLLTSVAASRTTIHATVVVSKATVADVHRTPKRTSKKRQSPDLSSPAVSQRTITAFYSPSPRKSKGLPAIFGSPSNVIDLVSSPAPRPDPSDHTATPTEQQPRPFTPTPPNTRFQFVRRSASPPPAQPDFSPGKLSDNVTKRRKKSPLKRWQTEPVYSGHKELVTIETSPGKDDGSLASPSATVQRRRNSEDLDGAFVRHDEDADRTPRPSIQHNTAHVPAGRNHLASIGAFAFTNPTLPSDHEEDEDDDLPLIPVPTAKTRPNTHKSRTEPQPVHPKRQSPPCPAPSTLRPSPRQQAKKKRIQLRESLEGAWKEVDAETIDMTGDGSGWKKSGGRATISGWRKSGVEVLDLTGA